jgi:aldose 1-dehydrogenase [NAD(P)+]
MNEIATNAVYVNRQGLIGVKRHIIKINDNSTLLRTLEVGICGTDRDLAAGNLSVFKPALGSDTLIIGHECLAEVYRLPKSLGERDLEFSEGDIVVPIVRRPCNKCRMCKIGMPEYCESGEFEELGIIGVNGCMTEYFLDDIYNLVKVPKEIKDIAVLTEPLSGLEKAIKQIIDYQKRYPWRCEDGTLKCKNALIIGTGPIAFLIAIFLKTLGLSKIVMSNVRDLKDIEKSIVNELGLKFYNSSQGYSDLYSILGSFDLVFDTAGDPSSIIDILNYMSYNSILLLYAFPRGKVAASLDPKIITNIVYRNIGILGSVTGPKWGFNYALMHLSAWKLTYGDVLKKLITHYLTLDEVQNVLKHKLPNEIKAVIKFH